MPFKKGQPKTPGSGRAKGTPNKFKLDATEICESMDFHPIEALAQIAKTTRIEQNKIAAAKELAKYTNAQKKAIEHSGSIDIGLQAIVDELKGLSDEDLKKILKEDDK